MNVLNDWATDPDASHVAVTPDDAELEDLFADLAANISKPRDQGQHTHRLFYCQRRPAHERIGSYDRLPDSGMENR